MEYNFINKKEERTIKKPKNTKVSSDFQESANQYQKRWRQLQQRRYIEFLADNLYRFENEDPIFRKKIFVQMSKYVGTRNRNQCKGHHQKMLRKCKSIQAILNDLSSRFKFKQNLSCSPSTSLCSQTTGELSFQNLPTQLDTYLQFGGLHLLLNPGWLNKEKQKLIDFTFQNHEAGNHTRANLFDELGCPQ